MELYYTLIIGFLFILAISLLIVGVSNDAVNFLNSALGAKAAPFKVILAIAAVGILAGAIFSNGMMEVARKGIFNPEYFAFSEIMVIFLAVMLANVLLLDFFNTFGLPTSTTISIVFGILGAAAVVGMFKVRADESDLLNLSSLINIENSVLIIIGIFLSIAIAFTAGLIIQWIIRFLFSFNIGKSYKYWAGPWGGFAITAILYFLLIKGAKGSTIISSELIDTIHNHTGLIMLLSFISWTILFQILVLFTRVNILKIVVLAGTFALAMAFAGNDLVNFIGVPLAGFESFKDFLASGSTEPDLFPMKSLAEPVNTPVLFLIAAGTIMVLTLRFSKKAKAVTATTIDLSRQDEGAERFDSSALARFIVRRSIQVSTAISKITPPPIKKIVSQRFNSETVQNKDEEKLAFDLVRASVNLVVASILIAIGTSLKLPLSTTYVTFMVAMGTSLADGAWGRDSAVFRISGVLTVIGGWFFTAFIAFLASFIIAGGIFLGKLPVIIFMVALSIYILLKTNKPNGKDKNIKEDETKAISDSYKVLRTCDNEVRDAIIKVSKILFLTYKNFFKENHKELKKLKKETANLNKEIKQIRECIPETLAKFEDSDLISGHIYVQLITYMKEMSNSLTYIVQPAYNHVDNNHAFDKVQNDQLKAFNEEINKFFEYLLDYLDNKENKSIEELYQRRDEMTELANDILLSRVKILKKNKKGVKISITYIEMMSETKNLLLSVVQLVKTDIKLLENSHTD